MPPSPTAYTHNTLQADKGVMFGAVIKEALAAAAVVFSFKSTLLMKRRIQNPLGGSSDMFLYCFFLHFHSKFSHFGVLTCPKRDTVVHWQVHGEGDKKGI